MNHWEGAMNWPLKQGWVCEICGDVSRYLIWGLPHGLCRCNTCHTQYRMRDAKDNIIDVPICQIKPEYYEVWKKLWNETHKPIDLLTDEEWDKEIGEQK